jgi:kinesin family member 15
MDDNDDLRKENKQMTNRISHVKTLCERKDNMVMSTKMVVRLREAQIAKLEMAHRHEDAMMPPCTADEDELREEIKALRSIVDMHPDVTRFALENLELREAIYKQDQISFLL